MKKIIFVLLLTYSTLSYSAKWECINRLILACNTWRMEVIHGWLIASDNPSSDDGYGITFIPDEKHEWVI